MKKLFLGLLATVMFSFSGNAQNTYAKSSMVVLVTQAKSSYTKGMGYKDWILNQTGNTTVPTAQEDKLLKDVYGFVSTGAKSDVVFKNYDGVSIVELAKLYEKEGLTVLGESNQRCGWWCQLIIKLITIFLGELPNAP